MAAAICWGLTFSTVLTLFVIPTIYARAGDSVLLHGSAASRMLRQLRRGVEVCVTVTLIDGLVFARSAFHHSMNYRSVVLFGRARAVEETSEKQAALRSIVEHSFPGRYDEIRGPSRKELRQTAVLALPIEEASAKARSGPPVDEEEDYALDVWAGVLPLALTPRAPVPDPRLSPGGGLPELVSSYSRPGKGGPGRVAGSTPRRARTWPFVFMVAPQPGAASCEVWR